jgi:hypothetical protein
VFTNDVNACNTSVSTEWSRTQTLPNNPRCTQSTPDTNFNIAQWHCVDQKRTSCRTVPVIRTVQACNEINQRSSLNRMSVGSSSLSRYQCTNFSLASRCVASLWTIIVYPQRMQVQFCRNSWWRHRYACLLCESNQISSCTSLLSRTNFVSFFLSEQVSSACSFPEQNERCCSRPLRVFVNRALTFEQAQKKTSVWIYEDIYCLIYIQQNTVTVTDSVRVGRLAKSTKLYQIM